jgi:uncharacterized protein with HEPN domain
MDERDRGRLLDILQAARRATAFVANTSREAFVANEMCHYAVIAQLQIIGEAAKALSPAFRSAHPRLPWNKMARMRDFLIHQYDHINLDIVWEAANVSLPEAIRYIAPLFPPDARP